MTEYEDMHEYWRFEGPTTRLAKNGFTWGMPPRSEYGRNKWEREADKLLGAAYQRLGKDGAVWDAEGNRVWSLDQYEEGHGEVVGPDLVLNWAELEERADRLVIEVALIASLTASEVQVVEALAEGAQTGVYGWTDPVAARLGWTSGAVRKHWSVARKKLKTEWAAEPDPRVRTRLRSCTEGNGHTLWIGRPRSWGRIVSEADREEALVLRLTEALPDRDWRYEKSLTGDGWQLWDDNLWSDWAPRWLA